MMFKLIVAGGRDFDNDALLFDSLDHLLMNKTDIEIVSGHAPRGADKWGEIYAKTRGYKLKLFPADWDKHGKAAGPIRNKQMADYADALVAFWDCKSPGTKSMIQLAAHLPTRIIRY